VCEFIALHYLLDFYHLHRAVPIEEDTISSHAKPITVFVVHQRLHVAALGHVCKVPHRAAHFSVIGRGELAQLTQRFLVPGDPIHKEKI